MNRYAALAAVVLAAPAAPLPSAHSSASSFMFAFMFSPLGDLERRQETWTAPESPRYPETCSGRLPMDSRGYVVTKL